MRFQNLELYTYLFHCRITQTLWGNKKISQQNMYSQNSNKSHLRLSKPLQPLFFWIVGALLVYLQNFKNIQR